MNKKQIIIIAAAVLLIALISAIIIGIVGGGDNQGNEVSTTLYFVNREKTSIEQSNRTVYYRDKDDMVYKIAEELKKSSSNKMLAADVSVKSIKRNDDNTMKIDVSSGFLTGDKNYDILRTYAFIKSMCAAGSVIDAGGVKLTVEGRNIIGADGEVIDYLYAGDVNLSSDMADISDDVIALYHLTRNNMLHRETYSVAVSGKMSTERFILERLAINPENEYLKSAYVNNDGIINAQTVDGICFVNLKNSFVRANTDGKKDKTVIYSMVNSLTELDDVDGVVFLIDGKRCENFGTVDIANVLKADNSIVENR